MKNTIEKISFFIMLVLSATELNAQLQNTWVGGTPGRPTDWNVASNWSRQQVPGAFDDILVPNTSTTTFLYPTIAGNVEINSLTIESGAKLVILETGILKLNSAGAMNEALANYGELENRSRHLIEFNPSVSEGAGSEVLAARKF